jgi:hypothetical protein
MNKLRMKEKVVQTGFVELTVNRSQFGR